MKEHTSLVLGLGETGYSVIRHLHDRERVIACDSRLGKHTREIPHLGDVRKEFPDVWIVPPRRFTKALERSDRVIASPGVALSDSLLRLTQLRRLPIVGDVDLFMNEVHVPVIGITGTNGKSTTVSLVGELLGPLGFRVCGNIGPPVLDALDDVAKGYVVELSSFQLERLQTFQFDVSAILNITEDHFDHHDSFNSYVESKRRIHSNTRFAVFNGNDANTSPQASSVDAIAINRDPDWNVTPDGVVVGGVSIAKEEIALKGTHNLFNLVAAGAIASRFGVGTETIREVASSYSGLPHRSQFVGNVDGIEFCNDSKATNVAAAVAAVQGLHPTDGRLIVIVGGEGKGANFEPLGKVIDEHVDLAVLMGRDAELIGGSISRCTCRRAESMAEAVRVAHKFAKEGDRVLLSPACASFDMFRNFEHRGQVFTQEVRALQS